MAAVVLESSMGSEYEDSPTSYEFPLRYLKFFKHDPREPLYVVLYEPRGDNGRGRMKYVGWAEVAGEPVPTGRVSASRQPLFAVQYTEAARAFDLSVPREIMGTPMETWLGKFERGRPRNVATFGRAVRPLTDEDLARIFEFAGARLIEVKTEPTDIRERVAVLTNVLQRSEQFRRQVIGGYGEACAVSGFALGAVPLTKSSGLLDAAHIRPVASNGPDRVSNGLALTPTLHRLFDAGLFTATYQEGRPRLLVSPRLERRMIESPDGRFRLTLEDGAPVKPPTRLEDWPSRDQLDFHRSRIFIAS